MLKIINKKIFIIILFLTFSYQSYAKDVSKKNKLFFFYKEYISNIDGDRCPMHPSCSSYSKKAFEKHGFFRGFMMTFDRLIRCGGSEVELAESVEIGRKRFCFDPVEHNDFWW